ncbi:MAG: FHA domain-containing protein [Bryobacteraceae bacterium]
MADGKLTGQIIIDQLIRNMEMGQFEMAYSVLLPCVYSLYLHPDDYTRLTGVMDLIKEDARRALSARLAQLNAKPLSFALTRTGKDRREYKIACKDWALEFFPDSEGSVPAGDVEIHSDLNETPQPGYHGTKTTLLDREPSVPDAASRPLATEAGSETRKSYDRVHAEIRYEDDSGPQLFMMTQNEIIIGRGGNGLQVNLALYSNDEVSREHLRIRRDPATGQFAIVDQSRNGTWVNGRRLTRGVQEKLPDQAHISVAEVITLLFEAKK